MVCISVAVPSEPATAVSKSKWLLSPLDPTDVLEIDHAEHATMVVGRESRNRTVVLACYAKNDTAKRTALEQVAYFNRNQFIMYAATSQLHICEQFEKTIPSLLVFNPYQQTPKSWIKTTKGLASRGTLTGFLRAACEPLVVEFDRSASQGNKIAKSPVKLLAMLVIDRKDKWFWPTMSEFSALAHDFVGKAHFYYAQPSSRRVLSYFNISARGPFPALVSLDMRKGWAGAARTGRLSMPKGEQGIRGMRAEIVRFLGTPEKWKSLQVLGLSLSDAAKAGKPLKPQREDPVYE